jgi:hypothetical protein
MDRSSWTIQRFASLDEMKADEYRYWQRRPDHERIAEVSKLTSEAYRLKGSRANVSRLQRPLVRLER